MAPRTPAAPLFPYTTLFRSHCRFQCKVGLRTTWSAIGAGPRLVGLHHIAADVQVGTGAYRAPRDRKSTRLNSSHPSISYAVCCLKKKICAPGGTRAALQPGL